MATGTQTEVVMPQMGVSVSEGTVTKWLKQAGEPVALDEPLLEISTDKVDTEVPSPGEGVVSQILVEEGATVDVGTVLAIIGPEAAAPASTPEPAAPEPVAAPATEPAPEPYAGTGDTACCERHERRLERRRRSTAGAAGARRRDHGSGSAPAPHAGR